MVWSEAFNKHLKVGNKIHWKFLKFNCSFIEKVSDRGKNLKKKKNGGKGFWETEENTSDSICYRQNSFISAPTRRLFISSVLKSRTIGELYILKCQHLNELLLKQIKIGKKEALDSFKNIYIYSPLRIGRKKNENNF